MKYRMVEKIPSWIKKLLLPKLSEITGEIKAINARIDSLEKRVDSLEKTFNERFVSLRNEMLTRFDAVDKKIESLRSEMFTKFDSLEKRIPMMEKLTELEIRIARLEKEKQVVKS
jgi:tetrahydromethanopterin S-methyltransferase subunit G